MTSAMHRLWLGVRRAMATRTMTRSREPHLKAREAQALGERVAELVRTGRQDEAYATLAPVLAKRTPFPMLGRIGEAIGGGPPEAVNAFLEQVAGAKTEGGWVVIGTALGRQLDRDPGGAFVRCRAFIVAAGVLQRF